MEKELERAKAQARAQLDSIIGMVKRLKHCEDCSGEDCELTDEEIYDGLGLSYQEGDKATDEEREDYHDEDSAREAIDNDPLSVEVRSDWHSAGDKGDKPTEYRILLCTGGPAVQITGDLDEYGQPENAKLEYQDWFTPWTEYTDTTSEEDEYLEKYAQQFYFAE
jgi:hypothetical protein